MVKAGNSALTNQQCLKVWSLQNPPQMPGVEFMSASRPFSKGRLHHHYQVLGSGGVLNGAQWARSQPPSTQLPFAWSSITPSLQVNKAPKLCKVGQERPQNPMTSQTWLFSQGDRDVTPALPDHAALEGHSWSVPLHMCLCACLCPQPPCRPRSGHLGQYGLLPPI